TTPYCTNGEGRGPAWSNSLFEDNAEFGFGMRLAVDQHAAYARSLVAELVMELGEEVVGSLLHADQSTEAGVVLQRQRVASLKQDLTSMNAGREGVARRLLQVADYLVKKSVWLIGGDGWAYDIGYGGLDHVLASGADVNVLVLDTEVYSNTGGQASKATPLGAAAKFAAAGKATGKKDLGLMAMNYGHVYVASIAMGANDNHTVKAFQEAESYPGPSLIIAYSHCIAHGYDLAQGMNQQKLAVDTGVWPLYRFDPRLVAQGQPPLTLDSKPAKTGKAGSVIDYMANETRFRMIQKQDPARFKILARAAQDQTQRRTSLYQHMAGLIVPEPDLIEGV
ncbi:MAG: thiamine pyrophosphate-dependent enzyme, partial [Phycisphaeraceae bacterium]